MGNCCKGKAPVAVSGPQPIQKPAAKVCVCVCVFCISTSPSASPSSVCLCPFVPLSGYPLCVLSHPIPSLSLYLPLRLSLRLSLFLSLSLSFCPLIPLRWFGVDLALSLTPTFRRVDCSATPCRVSTRTCKLRQVKRNQNP